MAGIYFHIPFCRQACHYCDFHFSTNLSVSQPLIDAMVSEMELRRNYLADPTIHTLYFGGGTPSMLRPEAIGKLIHAAHDLFEVAGQAEVTLEANPDDLSIEHLRALKSLGINRLSIGIQSFHDRVLAFLNRAHDGKTAIAAVDNARKAGFENISIDLIYGIPDVDTTAWMADIQQAINLAPEHISAYSLTIEPQTVFGHRASKGKLAAISDDISAAHLEVLAEQLEHAGFEQYEVSNFCKPGMESKHNSSYWKQHPYLGIGPSAHSYDLRSRQHNVANNHLYLRSLGQGVIPCETEALSHAEHVNEYLLTTLRTKWGSDLGMLHTRYGYNVMQLHTGFIQSLLTSRLAVVENDVLRLTRAGRLLADEITARLFLTP